MTFPVKHHRGSYRLGLTPPQPHRVSTQHGATSPPPRWGRATRRSSQLTGRVICMQTVHALKHGARRAMNISDNAQKSPDWLCIASDSNLGLRWPRNPRSSVARPPVQVGHGGDVERGVGMWGEVCLASVRGETKSLAAMSQTSPSVTSFTILCRRSQRVPAVAWASLRPPRPRCA